MNVTDPVVLRTAGLIAAGSLFWLLYWDMKDRRRPEPRANLAAAFVLGVAAAVVATWVYRALDALGVPTFPGGSPSRTLLVTFGVVGPVEEGAKMLFALLVVFRWKCFDERVDGIVYAAAISLGFAAAENVVWLPGLATQAAAVRALCAPLVHTLFGALWGVGAAYALLCVRGRIARAAWLLGSFALGAAAHGGYDAVLEFGASSYAVAAVVLVLWVAVLALTRRAALGDVRNS